MPLITIANSELLIRDWDIIRLLQDITNKNKNLIDTAIAVNYAYIGNKLEGYDVINTLDSILIKSKLYNSGKQICSIK